MHVHDATTARGGSHGIHTKERDSSIEPSELPEWGCHAKSAFACVSMTRVDSSVLAINRGSRLALADRSAFSATIHSALAPAFGPEP